MAQWVGEDPVVVEVGKEICFSKVWCTGCEYAKDRQSEIFGPISAPVTYYCSKHGFRVPAYHPTVDCSNQAKKRRN